MPTPSIAELTGPMLKKQMFVVFARLNAGQSLDALLADHLQYMIALEEAGQLFASGPLLNDDGTLNGEGLTILRAASLEEARHLAAADPFVQAGARSVEVKPWRLMEGRVAISVNLSRGTFSFD